MRRVANSWIAVPLLFGAWAVMSICAGFSFIAAVIIAATISTMVGVTISLRRPGDGPSPLSTIAAIVTEVMVICMIADINQTIEWMPVVWLTQMALILFGAGEVMGRRI